MITYYNVIKKYIKMEIGNKITNNNSGINYVVNKQFKTSTYPIYEIKINNEIVPFLLKEFSFTDKYGQIKNDYENELYFLKIASKLRVCPRLIYNKIINKGENEIGILIMEKFGEGTLTDLYKNGLFENKTQLTNISLQIKNILDKLYKNGISHNDLHSDNFLYHYDEEQDKYLIKIIDFDKSIKFNPLTDRTEKMNPITGEIEPGRKISKIYVIEILVPGDIYLNTQDIFITERKSRSNKKRSYSRNKSAHSKKSISIPISIQNR